MPHRTLATVSLVLLLTQCNLAPVPDSLALQGIEDLEFVAWITGPDSPNQTPNAYDIYGTDLGSMFANGDQLYIAFGDTFGCCRRLQSDPGGKNWRSNVLAVSSDHNPEDGITFDTMMVDEQGRARMVLHKSPGDITIIPTAGIAIADRLYLHYMAVRSWDFPGQWTINRSGLAYSDDGGQSWTQPPETVWAGDGAFGQAAFVPYEDYIYLFGIHGGRSGGAALARVPSDALLDLNAYRYWDGYDWTDDLNGATNVVEAPVGELSVAWNSYLGRWIMTYLDKARRAIVIREAAYLTGPWSEPLELVTADDYPLLYGAYLHPWASDGEVIYFNMSQWGPYNVRLMRARLAKRNDETTDP